MTMTTIEEKNKLQEQLSILYYSDDCLHICVDVMM